MQFGTFLANSCTMDDYSRKIPTLDRLVKEYHVSPDVAFFLWRPIFSFLIGVLDLVLIFLLLFNDYTLIYLFPSLGKI